MYHENGMTQDEISKRLGLSRPQVSRCLTKAKDIGIVQITLNSPVNQDYKDLEEKLKQVLGLKQVIIARVVDGSENKKSNHLAAISLAASKYLPDLIKNSLYVGVGWGRTVYNTVLAMEHSKDKEKITFIPLVGSMGLKAPHYQVNSIVDRIAEKFKAESLFINNPAFMADAKTRDLVMNDVNFSSVTEAWKKIDTAIIGLGPFFADPSYLENELKNYIRKQLVDGNAIGDILGHFFDKEGNICSSDLGYELLGINIEDLKQIKNVICLSGGVEKVDGIIAAANKQFFNILVTDDITASEILSIQEENK